ncbi:MAG: endonuclease III domain-containing protein [Candidatus Nanoarchaeia archaeon]|nr:endonuclease III domain-containing protein [Candidatus Nanoarchaeia archaeon]
MITLLSIYNKLLNKYGYQGWWPLIEHEGNNPTKTGSIKGYHVNDYSFPKNDFQRFEICIGVILTQNTNWVNVEKSLNNLYKNDFLSPEKIINNIEKVKELIKPSGYFNIKAGYLFNFSKFYLSLKARLPSRDELLSVKGIGKETADSILLYAYNQPIFVVDVYTKRIFNNLRIINSINYEEIRAFFENELPKDYRLFQEFHALIVEHAKNHYIKKPYGLNDFLV